MKRRIALLQDFTKQSEENARIAKEDIFGMQNTQKAITGYLSGLLDKVDHGREVRRRGQAPSIL